MKPLGWKTKANYLLQIAAENENEGGACAVAVVLEFLPLECPPFHTVSIQSPIPYDSIRSAFATCADIGGFRTNERPRPAAHKSLINSAGFGFPIRSERFSTLPFQRSMSG